MRLCWRRQSASKLAGGRQDSGVSFAYQVKLKVSALLKEATEKMQSFLWSQLFAFSKAVGALARVLAPIQLHGQWKETCLWGLSSFFTHLHRPWSNKFTRGASTLCSLGFSLQTAGNISTWVGREGWRWTLPSPKRKPVWLCKCALSGIMKITMALMQSAEVMSLIPTRAWREPRRLCIISADRSPGLPDCFGCTGTHSMLCNSGCWGTVLATEGKFLLGTKMHFVPICVNIYYKFLPQNKPSAADEYNLRTLHVNSFPNHDSSVTEWRGISIQ